MDYRIFPPDEDIDVTLDMPASKSIVAREAVIRALCGASPVPAEAAAACDDTRAVCAGVAVTEGEVDCGLSATALRLLTAFHASVPGREVVVTGRPRLLERPVQPLVDALDALGGDVRRLDDGSLHVRGRRLRGGTLDLEAGVSSQFATALMLPAPYMEKPLELRLQGDPVSAGYRSLTAACMGRYGVDAEAAPVQVDVPLGAYDAAVPFEAGGDWSCASFWYELEALTMGTVRLRGLRRDSAQPDAACARLWQALGVETVPDGDALSLEPSPDQLARLSFDMGDNPDAVPPLAVACVCLGVPFDFHRLDALRHKESDRVTALRDECLKLGAVLEDDPRQGVLSWDGTRVPVTEMPVIDPRGDHRMAMAAAPAAWYVPGIVVRDAECVSKSYPLFWEHLRAAGFRTEETA